MRNAGDLPALTDTNARKYNTVSKGRRIILNIRSDSKTNVEQLWGISNCKFISAGNIHCNKRGS